MSSPLQQIRQKLYSPEEIIRKTEEWRNSGETIIFTNGCFDILHAGHIDYLARAASLGTKLIIALNSDQSVSKLKGPARPLQKENDRAFVLSALDFVSAVVLFSEDTPEKLIRTINPDILVKGADYSVEQVAGSEFIIQNGGSVVLLPILKGRSTSKVIERMKN
jgi:rfaE bifunctional protein nucleotidyltransferase chain/domain